MRYTRLAANTGGTCNFVGISKLNSMALKTLVPIAFRKELKKGESLTLLAADIGGTKTNVALCRADSEGVTIDDQRRYVSKDHPSLSAIVHDYCKGKLPDRISAAVAGPVVDGNSKLTNLPWVLDSAAMSKEMGVPVCFINDLEATAYWLA